MNNNTTKTPPASTDGGSRVKVLVDQDMADTVARLNNLQQLLGMVNGSLKRELHTPDRVDGATKGE
jgi:hypothetical protein